MKDQFPRSVDLLAIQKDSNQTLPIRDEYLT